MKLRIILSFGLLVMGGALDAETPKKAAPTAEAAPDSRLVLKSVLERYRKLGSWRARFTQETFSLGLGTGSLSEGEFEFVKPSSFRYSLMRPQISDFVSNGKEAWQVVFRKGREHPAYVRHFKKLASTDLGRYLVIFRGPGEGGAVTEQDLKNVEKNFRYEGTFRDNQLEIHFFPKGNSEIAEFQLFFKNDVEAPYRMEIRDTLGTRTVILIASFEGIPPKKAAKISFSPQYVKTSEVEEIE